MPFWNKGGESDEAVDDFDEYDPTPYGGGYDLQLTYGRPIPPSEDTCYPVSASAGVDYDRPSYSSGSKPSAYEPEIESDYGSGDRYGHSRPKPQPAYGFHPQEESRPKPNLYGGGGEDDYGSGYSQPKPDYGSGGGGYGSGYSQPKPDYGSGGGVGGGYGSEYSQPKPEYGSGGGYGSGYSQPKPDYGSGGGGGYGSGYKKPSYGGGEEEEEEDGRYNKRNEEEYGYGGRKKEHGSGGGSGYRKSGYGEEVVVEEGSGGYGGGRTTYDRPSLGGEEEGVGRYQEPSHYGGQDYGRKKYVSSLSFPFLHLFTLFFSKEVACVSSSVPKSLTWF
ncbi:uncharacterized protein M6B38_408155 [Iris pallida]|uniref:Pro-resilin n=1 Tax=Iris pallida TaxID=29817 RepID=A0AAX6FPN8_IRIPA|nr:uncharacterized protein M6B38_408155 [Iris pallida]